MDGWMDTDTDTDTDTDWASLIPSDAAHIHLR